MQIRRGRWPAVHKPVASQARDQTGASRVTRTGQAVGAESRKPCSGQGCAGARTTRKPVTKLPELALEHKRDDERHHAPW